MTNLNYGGCSSVAERATVARITGVRFSPIALQKEEKMKILFICKYNAFRSRVAEEYFKKINKNSKIDAISRGIIIGGDSDQLQKDIAKDILDADISKRSPFPLNVNDLKESDLIIVVADDIPKIIFNYQLLPIREKVVIWKIKDEQKGNKENIKKIVLTIKKRVDELNKKLERK